MGISQSPKITTDGLVFCYDQNNIKSYKGPAVQNLAQTITATNTGTDTGYSSTGGTETIDVPQIGPSTVAFNVIQNNYTSFSPNSTSCCPAPIGGYGGFTVSPSTLYTYGIVYKVLSGYTHPNYMYRYEYTANGGSYVTEAGVHNDSNRIHLGDGWYWAWGTFTTQATTNWFNSGSSFYYRYSNKTDKLSVAKVLIVAGDYTGLHPKYWPNTNTTRSNTQAILDPSMSRNTITTTSLTYAANGSFSFNNFANSTLNIPDSTLIRPLSVSISAWVNLSAFNPLNDFDGQFPTIAWKGYDGQAGTQASYALTLVTGAFPRLTIAPSTLVSTVALPTNTWVNIVGTYTTGGAMVLYRNAEVDTTGTGPAAISYAAQVFGIGTRTFSGANQYPWNGSISLVQLYNRALTAAEVQQNFNALRGRYGV